MYKFIKSTTKLPPAEDPVTTYFWEDVGDATSDVHGEFWFTKLDPGTYEVRERANQTDSKGVVWIQSHLGTDGKLLPVPGDTTNPAASLTEFNILSRREYVWRLGAASRPIDGMGGPARWLY